MSYGLLKIPTEFVSGEPTGDPVLGVFLDFAQCVLNHYCGDAWRVVYPGPGSVPVRTVFPFTPSKDYKFSDKDLPALFIEREYTEPTEQIGGDLHVARSVLKLLWIHPSGPTEKLKAASRFWNAIDKTLRLALETGRDRSWVVPGDTYYSPSFYGSSLMFHTQCHRIGVGRSQPERVDIEYEGQRKTDAPGYLGVSIKINISERSNNDALYKRVPLTGIAVTLNGNSDDVNGGPLVLQLATFGLRVNTVTPSTGPIAGGTTVRVAGLSFTGETTFTIDGVAVTPEYVSVNEVELVTPAHAAGAVSLVATNPGDESFTLPNAFTFT